MPDNRAHASMDKFCVIIPCPKAATANRAPRACGTLIIYTDQKKIRKRRYEMTDKIRINAEDVQMTEAAKRIGVEDIFKEINKRRERDPTPKKEES